MIFGFNAEFARDMVTMLPGEIVVTKDDVVLSTILRTCVSTILYDPLLLVGGLNHFVLSRPPELRTIPKSEVGRFGVGAMPILLNRFQAAGGGNIRAMIIGGSVPKEADDRVLQIASDNIRYAQYFLAVRGVTAAVMDVGGTVCRKVLFRPATGTVVVTVSEWGDRTCSFSAEPSDHRRMDNSVEVSTRTVTSM